MAGKIPETNKQIDPILAELKSQQSESETISRFFTDALRRHFPNAKVFDVSSFIRGTNVPGEFDIDLAVDGIRFGPRLSPKLDSNEGSAITPTDPPIKSLEHLIRADNDGQLFDVEKVSSLKKQGITVDYLPGKMAQVVQSVLKDAVKLGSSPQFERVKAWDNAAGVVFAITLDYPKRGRVSFDITLYNGEGFLELNTPKDSTSM